MSYLPYPKYQNCGLYCLGSIPTHWKLLRLKYIASLRNEKIPALTYPDEYVGLESIESWTGRRIEGSNSDEAEGTANRFYAGDVLFGKLRPYLAKVYLCPAAGIASTETFVLRPHATSSEYLRYLLLSSRFIDIVNSSTYGAKMPRANWEFVANVRWCVPPLGEQRAIAAFLDRETAQIDTLIDKQQRLITLLQEKRQALISHAVTKGLDPSAPMKESGIQWLGTIPADWGVAKIKRIVSLKSGDNITSEELLEDGEFPVYGGNGLRGYFNQYTHDGDYILIGRQGALCGNVNYASGKFWASEHAIVASPLREFDVRYLGEVLRTMNLNQYSVSAAQPGLAVSTINELSIPIPSLAEQQTISKCIQEETEQINEVMSKCRESISALLERRSALITAAVTGQIDVRGSSS